MWHNDTGNHTWIEVWEDGRWHFVEAYSSDGYDQAWWTAHAKKADSSSPRYSVWATSYRPSGAHFPLEWDPADETIPAVNVTERFSHIAFHLQRIVIERYFVLIVWRRFLIIIARR